MVPSIYGENMFDEFFDNNGFFGSHSPLFGKNSKNLMKTDIRATDDAKAYRFAVELPGFKKDEISLDIKDGYLTIAAQKGLDKDEQDKKGRVLRQERYAGACSRSFYVGNVKPEDVKAKYEDGVLSVIVPKEDVKKFASSTAIDMPTLSSALRASADIAFISSVSRFLPNTREITLGRLISRLSLMFSVMVKPGSSMNS